MISFVGLECYLFLGFEFVGLEFLNLGSEYGFGLSGRIDARRLDGNDKVSAVLEEILRVEGDDSGLIGLRNVSEHGVDHADQHAILVRMTSVFDDRNNIRSLLGDVDQITARSGGELDGIDETFGSDNVRDVGNCGSGSSAQIEDFGTGRHVDVVDTTENGGGQLRSERIPNAVLDFLAFSLGSKLTGINVVLKIGSILYGIM